MKFFIALILVFLMTYGACAKSPTTAHATSARGAGSCAEIDPDAARSIEVRLELLKKTSSVEEAERLGAELAGAFDSHSCALVSKAISAGLTDRQIARLISIMPVSFVDRPCASREKLLVRLRYLNNLVPTEGRADSIGAFLQESLRRDTRECRGKDEVSETRVPVAMPVPFDASLEGMKFLQGIKSP